jgi:tripartite-type tricarboxylate transporter receptor subunit TctC
MRNETKHQVVIISLLVALAFYVFSPVVFAQEKFPSKSINLLIPFPPGGNIDLVARPLAEATSEALGEPVLTVYKPGSGGTLMAATLKSMKPDGYNIGIGLMTIIYRAAQMDVPFDPVKDFTFICNGWGTVFGVCVRSDSSWMTFRDLVEYARANPGKLKYATSGLGGTMHLAMSAVALKEGIQWQVVPVKGGKKSVFNLLGGHVDFICQGPDWVPQVNSGEFRLLVTLGEKRTKLWPKVPCFKELGYTPNNSPAGIIGPSGMPKDRVDILDEAFKKAFKDPRVQKVFKQLNSEEMYMSSSDYTEWWKGANTHFSNVVKGAGLGKKK